MLFVVDGDEAIFFRDFVFENIPDCLDLMYMYMTCHVQVQAVLLSISCFVSSFVLLET